MGIKNLFSKLKKQSKPVDNTKKIESDDSYCYSNIVWNSKYNLIILLSFTEDYFDQIIDLQDSISNMLDSSVSSKIVYSSYDEETNEKDEDGNNIWIIHKKYYMLIGGHPIIWQELYKYANNLSSDVLNAISNEITNNCNSYYFYTIIKDGIIGDFKCNNKDPEYDIEKEIYEDGIIYTDPKVLMSRLPTGFTARDVLKFIKISDYGLSYDTDALTELANATNYTNDDFCNKYNLYNLYADLFNNPTVERLKLLLEPLYKQPDDDLIAGDVDDESLDAIFREHYERFSAVTDNSIHYEDIDEQLADDEESENMRAGDKINDD